MSTAEPGWQRLSPAKIEVNDLPDLSQRIAYAQASATLAVAKLLYKTQLEQQ